MDVALHPLVQEALAAIVIPDARPMVAAIPPEKLAEIVRAVKALGGGDANVHAAFIASELHARGLTKAAKQLARIACAGLDAAQAERAVKQAEALRASGQTLNVKSAALTDGLAPSVKGIGLRTGKR